MALHLVCRKLTMLETDEKRNIESGRVKRAVLISRLGQWLKEATDKRKAYCGSWLKGAQSTSMGTAWCRRHAPLARQPVNLLANT